MREVLIIDDNQSSHALAYVLRTEGYSSIIVGSVDEGLEKINASENLKVVLLNVELSANRGLDALERIKHEHPQVIVIVIGAGGQTARRALLRGAMEVLSRHTDMENICRAVDRAFSRIDSRSNTFSFPEEETEDEGSERSEPETRSSETPATPIYGNLLDLPVMVFCQFLSDGESGIMDRQIAEWWEAFSNDGRVRANSARREIDNWRLEFNTTNLEFPTFSDDWIRRVIDDAISQLSNLRHNSEPIEEAEPVSIKGRTRKGSLTAVLHEVVKGYGGDREKAARELRISLVQLERWLSYRMEDDDSLSTSIEASRRIGQFPYDEIKKLLTEPINLFILENFSRAAWRNKSLNGQKQAVHLALKVLSKRLDKDHGCIYFGGMTFSQIEWNVYRRAPYLYTDHAEAATALDVDTRTFRRYWPENKPFPSHHTLFRE